MISPVLRIKIIPPQKNPLIIQRDRLNKQIQTAAHARLIYISAPAGYGKTSLARSWIQATDNQVAWYTLEPTDNDLTQFLFYLLNALTRVMPDSFRRLIGTFQENEPLSPEQILTTLINKFAGLDKPIYLVLDDYHFIENKTIHDFMIFLLDHLPQQVQIIITSRDTAPFPLNRWRAKNQLIEINAQDLLFNYSEAEEFLNKVMNLQLTSNELRMVHDRSEGWATAIQLVALALRSTSNLDSHRSGLLNTTTRDHGFVLDYLNDEVLSQQQPEIRQFLLRTSLFDRFSPALCDHVFGIKNSEEIIDLLVAHNLFITPLDETKQWYRYHALFTELLRKTLQKELPQEINNLHLRASLWFAQNDAHYEAITHALSANDPSEVTRIAEKIILDLFAGGNPVLCRQWLSLIPIETIRQHPLLCLAQSSSISFTDPFDYDRIEFWAMCAKETDEELLSRPITHPKIAYKTVRDFVDAQIAWLQTSLARLRGKPPAEILQTAQNALELTSKDDYFISSSLWMSISRAYLNLGDPQQAEKAIRQALVFSEMTGNISNILNALWTQSYIAYWRGQFTKALQIFQDAEAKYISPGELKGEYYSPTSSLHTFRASILRELNQLDLAEEYFQKSQEITQYQGLSDLSLDNLIGLIWIDVYRGNPERIKELEELIPKLPAKKVDMVLFHVARMKLTLGEDRPDLAKEAFHWLNGMRAEWTPMQNLENTYLEWIRARLFLNDEGESLPVLENELVPLERQYYFAESARYLRSQVRIKVLQALIYEELGDFTNALQATSEALLLAKPEGYVRTFMDAGSPILPLLQAALNNQITPDYTKLLLNSFSEPGHHLPLFGDTENSLLPAIKPLTPREQEVLILVAEGLSNQQIAEKLVLSQGTIKKYLSSVYQKLYVHRRTQALLRAKELGIL